MGGSLTVADGPGGRGSRFTLVLPLAASDDAPATAAAHPPSLPGRTALIVADSPYEAPYLAERLAEAGVAVTLRTTDASARACLDASAPFDIVVVDCALGEAAARALGAAARDAGARRSFVMFSPFERRAFGQTSVRGFDGWLVKPVRRQTLFALLDETPAREPRPAAPSCQADMGRTKVLLAEDNEINALLATRHLQKLGATVTHAADGATALALAESALAGGTPFDAVVLDIRMPGLDGLEVARRLRLAESARGASPTRLVALSADLLDLDRHAAERGSAAHEAAGAGVDAFLGKPVTFVQLAAALGPALDRPTPDSPAEASATV